MANNDCKGKPWKLSLEYGEVPKYEFSERGQWFFFRHPPVLQKNEFPHMESDHGVVVGKLFVAISFVLLSNFSAHFKFHA